MSDKRLEFLKLRGEIGYALAAAEAVQGFAVPKEIYQISKVVKELTESWDLFRRSESFHQIGSAVQAFASTIRPLSIAANSPIALAAKAVGQMNLERDFSKTIMAAAKAVDSIGINQKYVAEFLNSSMNSELFELIRSGGISAAQIASGLEDATAAVGEVGDITDAVLPVTGSDLSTELVTAFQRTGSLKGLSHGALVLFLYLILHAFAEDPMGFLNKGFELQRNISGLFTSVKTPAEARAQARHLPSGADKSELQGFRVVTGLDIHLMDEPSRQAEAVLKIRIGSLVQVLDSTNRAWLYVSVMVDDELYEGWILRGYTKRIE